MAKRALIAIMIVLLACSLVAAQGYYIRAENRLNLRASPSLAGQFIETVPAGTVLHVIGSYNRWLKISRNGAEVWMADWLSYTRVDAPASQQTSTGPSPANIDNCCFVDRQCQGDAEWTAGYYAFQNGQCGAPAQSAAQPLASQPVSAGVANIASGAVDNCCQLGADCQTQDDWTQGYYDFQNNQCGITIENCCQLTGACQSDADWVYGYMAALHFQCNVPSPATAIRLEGSPAFVRRMQETLTIMRDRAMSWYAYSITGLSRIFEVPEGSASGVYPHNRSYQETLSEAMEDYPYVAGGIVHEACHIHQWEDGTATTGWRNELPCVQKQLEVTLAIDPHHYTVAWLRDLIANIRNPEYWWWDD